MAEGQQKSGGVVAGLVWLALAVGCGPTTTPPECTKATDCVSGVCDSGSCVAQPPAATLTVTPADVVVEAGGAAVSLAAVVTNSTAAVRWQLQGPGALSGQTGAAVTYAPPPRDAVVTILVAKVTASLEGTALVSTVDVAINPVPRPRLAVTPIVATVAAGGAPVELLAQVQDATAEVSWTLAGPGSLVAPTGLATAYLPPAVGALSAETQVRVTATLGAGGATAESVIAVRPVLGMLEVQVLGPAGGAPSVTVTGPGGFTRTLTASARLEGLVAGSYTVTPARLRVGAPVEALWTAAPETVVVSNGGVAASAAQWTKRPGTGALWATAMASATVMAFDSAQLAAQPGAAVVGLGVNPPAFSPTALAFDTDGSLWVANLNGGPVLHFPLSSLGASGTPTPDVVLTLSGPGIVRNLALDGDGTLWLASDNLGELYGIPRAQQAASGPVTPRQLSTSANPGWRFYGLALDASGRLWAGETTGHRLVAFSQAALRAGGPQAPEVVLEGAATRLNYPLGMAFDGAGALWVANYSGQPALLKFAAASLTSSGAPAPRVALSLGAGTGAFDVVPDKDGNLFVVDETYLLRRLPSSAVVSSGSPTATWTQQLGLQTFDLALNLPDARSPIVQ